MNITNITKYPSWSPVTEADPKPSTDPRDKPFDFELSPAERDIAVLAKLDILSMQRANSQFVAGIVAKELRREDLTQSELEAFGL